MQNLWKKTCLFLGLLTLPPAVSFAGENRFTIAGQYDFNNKLGFYIDTEAPQKGNASCRLQDTSLDMGIAQGSSWRFIITKPKWKYGVDYTNKGVITSDSASLYLDGSQIGKSEGGFKPFSGDLVSDSIPDWGRAPADFAPLLISLQITYGQLPTGDSAAVPTPLSQFDPSQETANLTSGETVTVVTVIRFLHNPSAPSVRPIIDRFGQAISANYSSKTKQNSDLLHNEKVELKRLASMTPAPNRDPYGGDRSLGWNGKKTGYYAILKHNGKWWLISPDGNPLFYTGVCTVNTNGDSTPINNRESLFAWLPPQTGGYQSAWSSGDWGQSANLHGFSFTAANQIRKYGSDWKTKSLAMARKRLKAWAFCGEGKWSDPIPDVPYLPVLYYNLPTLAGHIDPFDPAIPAKLHAALKTQIAPLKNDPWILGWSIHNEDDDIIKDSEITTIMNMNSEIPAKRGLTDYALNHLYHDNVQECAAAWKAPAANRDALYNAQPSLPTHDLEALREEYARRYYALLYHTVKVIDPNHLYFGFWIVLDWWQNEANWSLIAPYCDVIGYDRYAATFSFQLLNTLMKQTGKPTLCGEFGFPPFFNGSRGFGKYFPSSSGSQEEGELYKSYVEEAAHNPYCVGTMFFEYRDEPLTGRGPGDGPDIVYGEHYAFGTVDVTDRPYWRLVTQMRDANLILNELRMHDNAK